MKRLFVRHAGPWTVARMRVQPDATKLLGSSPEIDLLIKEIRDRIVVKRNVGPGTGLPDQLHVFDQQQVVSSGDPETAHFRVPIVT